MNSTSSQHYRRTINSTGRLSDSEVIMGLRSELETVKKEREAAVKLIKEYSDVIEGSTPFLNSLSEDKE